MTAIRVSKELAEKEVGKTGRETQMKEKEHGMCAGNFLSPT